MGSSSSAKDHLKFEIEFLQKQIKWLERDNRENVKVKIANAKDKHDKDYYKNQLEANKRQIQAYKDQIAYKRMFLKNLK